MIKEMKIIPKSVINSKIGSVIKKIGEKKGMSVTDIAESSKFSETMITRLEAGQYRSMPSYATLKQLAKSLGVEPKVLTSILLKAIGRRIELLRLSQGMTLSKLAHKLGVKKVNLNNIEQGKSKIETEYAKKIAHFFGVSYDFLICRTDNTTSGARNDNADNKDNIKEGDTMSLIRINMKDALLHKKIPVIIYYKGKKIDTNLLKLDDNIIKALSI